LDWKEIPCPRKNKTRERLLGSRRRDNATRTEEESSCTSARNKGLWAAKAGLIVSFWDSYKVKLISQIYGALKNRSVNLPWAGRNGWMGGGGEHVLGQGYLSTDHFINISLYMIGAGRCTVKKGLAIFPSPAGMSLTKLSLGGNNLFWLVISRLGTEKSVTFFTVCVDPCPDLACASTENTGRNEQKGGT
jgi:hypothetical protein